MDRDADTALIKCFGMTLKCVFNLPFVAVKVLLIFLYRDPENWSFSYGDYHCDIPLLPILIIKEESDKQIISVILAC